MRKRANDVDQEPAAVGSSALVRRPFGVRYRIVTDKYCGYAVQVWRWWWPFWEQHGFCNTHPSLETARDYIARECFRGALVEEWPPNEKLRPLRQTFNRRTKTK